MRSVGLLKWMTLLMIVGCLVIFGMLVYQSHQRTQRLLAMIGPARGFTETEPAGPAWFNRLLGRAGIGQMQRIVSVSFCGGTQSGLAPPTIGATATAAQAIVALRHEPRLRKLAVMHYSRLTDKELVGIEHLTSLEELTITGPGITDETGRRIGPLKSLRRLDLSFIEVGDETLEVISGLAELEYLQLTGTNITDAGLIHLRRMTNLRVLDIGHTPITDKGMAHLAGLTNLTRLIVGYTKITSAGLEHVRGMTELDQLYFDGTAVDDRFVDHIAHLPKLRLLSISGCSVTPAIFTKMMGMTTIEQFYIHSAITNSPQAKAFAAANGHPNVLR